MSDSHAALQNRIGNGFKTHDQHGIKITEKPYVILINGKE